MNQICSDVFMIDDSVSLSLGLHGAIPKRQRFGNLSPKGLEKVVEADIFFLVAWVTYMERRIVWHSVERWVANRMSRYWTSSASGFLGDFFPDGVYCLAAFSDCKAIFQKTVPAGETIIQCAEASMRVFFVKGHHLKMNKPWAMTRLLSYTTSHDLLRPTLMAS